jgi:hypothetical protein
VAAGGGDAEFLGPGIELHERHLVAVIGLLTNIGNGSEELLGIVLGSDRPAHGENALQAAMLLDVALPHDQGLPVGHIADEEQIGEHEHEG